MKANEARNQERQRNSRILESKMSQIYDTIKNRIELDMDSLVLSFDVGSDVTERLEADGYGVSSLEKGIQIDW